MHFLALSAELIEVYSDDFNAVEALMSILITNLFEVGRQLINEQMQCMHLLFVRQMDACFTEEDGTFILSCEVTR